MAAIIVLSLSKGKDEVKCLFRRISKWKVDFKWYLIILFIPLLLGLGPLGIAFLGGSDISTAFNPGINIFLVILMFFYVFITSGLEEPGWRGYALPELRRHFTAYKSSLILGFFWAIWHYPFYVYRYYFELKMGLILTIISLLGFTVLLMFGSVIFCWLYLNTESILLLILFHALQNFIPFIILNGIVDPLGGLSSALIIIPLIIIINRKFGVETLTGLTETEIIIKGLKQQKKKIEIINLPNFHSLMKISLTNETKKC